MKLLDKKTANAEVATQKKQQIDSGIKLAKKVDALRETLGEEEKNLETFRTETVKGVQIEIDSLIRQKDTIKEEINVLNRQKAKALVPLEVEWERVRRVSVKLEKDRMLFDQMSFSFTEREAEIERSEREAENEKERASNLKHRASEDLAEADSTLSHAREASAEIRNKAQVVLAAAETKEKEVGLKEKDLEVREEHATKEIERVGKWERDLTSREKKLRADREVFSKSRNYLKNKN